MKHLKKKTKELCILKDFLFSIGRKRIKTVVLNTFWLQLFLILYTPKHIYAFGEKKKRVKLEQVEMHKYPPAGAIIEFIKIIYSWQSRC